MPPRSLADDLRTRGDDALAALVLGRPDLIHPVPDGLAELAARAGSPASIALALRGYDELTLQVATAAALAADPIAPRDLIEPVAALLPGPVKAARSRVRAAVELLEEHALLWGASRALHLVGPARDLLVPVDRGPALAALDPVVAGYVADPTRFAEVRRVAPEGAEAILARLLAGPVVGAVAEPRRTPDPARSPVDWLLAHHLLVPFGADRVVLPGEVAALLRGAPLEESPSLVPPTPARPPLDVGRAQAGAAGALADVLHAVAELGEHWAGTPPSRTRAGGIAQRDLVATAAALATDLPTTILLAEVAAAAGLLALDAHEMATVLPTPAYDLWLMADPPNRMADLLVAWRDMTRTTEPGSRPFAPDGANPQLPALRRDVLAVLAGASGGWTDREVVAGLRWRGPRRHDPARTAAAGQVLADLGRLGLLAGGTLTEAGRALDADHRDALVAALATQLPPQTDAVILQADLTAIVPGLPTPELAALLRAAATAESSGAASVHRFSTTSLRRALDAGLTGGEILAALQRRGDVPQPLAYLIEDVARRHAIVRVGPAQSVLHCEDPVELARILAHPSAVPLRLTRVADTVLVSPLPPENVLDRLLALGFSPQAEVDGTLQPRLPRRAHARPRTDERPANAPVTAALAAAAVRAMRAGDSGQVPDQASRARDGRATDLRPARPGGPGGEAVPTRPNRPIPDADTVEAREAIESAITDQAWVWISYAEPNGTSADHYVEPLRLINGYLTATDAQSRTITTFALGRIRGVSRPDRR